MLAKIQKWGNSLGIRIPKQILKTANLNAESYVDIISTRDSIIIKPKKDPLDVLLDQITNDNLHNVVFDEDDTQSNKEW